jgi:hypothetical protein
VLCCAFTRYGYGSVAEWMDHVYMLDTKDEYPWFRNGMRHGLHDDRLYLYDMGN